MAPEERDPHGRHPDEEADEPEEREPVDHARDRREHPEPTRENAGEESQPADPARHGSRSQGRPCVQRDDDRPDEHVADVVEHEARDRPRVEVDLERGPRGARRVDVSGNELVRERERKRVRDRHEDEPDDGEDRPEYQQRMGAPQRFVEADETDQGEEPAGDDQPTAGEEQTARVIHVSNPVEAVLPGLRDEDLDAARHHEDDADEERQRRQNGADGADGREVRGLRRRIIFLLPGSRQWQSRAVATMADLDELALAMPQATKEVSDDGRPSYHVHGKLFCFDRGQRPDAIDPETGERMADVLMFRVADQDEKDLLLADDRGLFFTTPHFNGYPAVLMRIPTLEQMSRDELRDLVVDAWMSRAQKRAAKAWLAENEPESDDLQ